MRRLAQQIDLDGGLHDLAPQTERLRLFEPAPAQLAGQLYNDHDEESERTMTDTTREQRLARQEIDPRNRDDADYILAHEHQFSEAQIVAAEATDRATYNENRGE